MTVMKYSILENGPIPEEFLSKAGDKLLATILWNRGYRSLEDLEAILNPDSYAPCSPAEIPGMAAAVDIIAAAIKKGSRIAVYGDYDVDGVTSTALLIRTLKASQANVIYHVPNRFTEGYGMNCEVVRQLAGDGCQLIITCDCGISNHQEITLAKELGISVIVTDHHNIPETMVCADVIVNPKMLPDIHPCHHIPGVGVAYLLSLSLQENIGFTLDFDPLQLVALGVISDVVPLNHENRFWVKKGLEVLNSGQILTGIKTLLKVSKVDLVDEDIIGFQLGPRLNAPGRLTSAEICVKLLLTDDPVEANALALEIDSLNKQRKLMITDILKEFTNLTPEGCIVRHNPYWHEGVIGIVAGRLCETYGVPVVLLTTKEDGETVSGSARSIDGVNMFERLQAVNQYLTGFGGHAKAAGLRTDTSRLNQLISSLNKELAVNPTEFDNNLVVDMELPIDQIDIAIHDQIRRIAPYGEGFKKPVFYAPNVRISEYQAFANGKYTRLRINKGTETIPAIWWESGFSGHDEIQVIYTVGVNRFNGATAVQLEIITYDVIANSQEIPLAIEDRRYLPGNPPPVVTGDNIGIFVEGRRAKEGEFNRYQIRPCETLVLSTIPPSLQILKDIVKKSGCTRLVLAYKRSYWSKPLLYKLMGVLKGVVSRNELTSVYDLAVACEQTETAIFAGLRVLEDGGFIHIGDTNGQFEITLSSGGSVKPESKPYYQFIEAETENTNYQKWMCEVGNELDHILCSK